MGDLVGAVGSWLQPSLALAILTIWDVNQQIKDLSLYATLSNKYN